MASATPRIDLAVARLGQANFMEPVVDFIRAGENIGLKADDLFGLGEAANTLVKVITYVLTFFVMAALTLTGAGIALNAYGIQEYARQNGVALLKTGNDFLIPAEQQALAQANTAHAAAIDQLTQQKDGEIATLRGQVGTLTTQLGAATQKRDQLQVYVDADIAAKRRAAEQHQKDLAAAAALGSPAPQDP
ncbi:MAG: hypothetical protein HYX48_03300 [Chlamydiales bacterium]|nr:hypothetical protein [Chlamydiales bacterium]